jgi:hypothetical protein
MYALKAFMYHPSHLNGILHVLCKSAHVPLESCVRQGLVCTTRVINICRQFAEKVIMYHSSHVCDKGFYVRVHFATGSALQLALG